MLLHWNLQKRIAALAVLRSFSHASLIEWRIVKDALKVLELSKEELQTYDIQPLQGGGVAWNEKGKEERAYEITTGAYNLIEQAIVGMDAKNNIHRDIYELAEEVLSRTKKTPVKKAKKPVAAKVK